MSSSSKTTIIKNVKDWWESNPILSKTTSCQWKTLVLQGLLSLRVFLIRNTSVVEYLVKQDARRWQYVLQGFSTTYKLSYLDWFLIKNKLHTISQALTLFFASTFLIRTLIEHHSLHHWQWFIQNFEMKTECCSPFSLLIHSFTPLCNQGVLDWISGWDEFNVMVRNPL